MTLRSVAQQHVTQPAKLNTYQMEKSMLETFVSAAIMYKGRYVQYTSSNVVAAAVMCKGRYAQYSRPGYYLRICHV